MAEIDVNLLRDSLLGDATARKLLPDELLLAIEDGTTSSFLDGVSIAALLGPLTSRIFTHFETVFADIAARWVTKSRKCDVRVLAAFARVLPFSPYLSVYLRGYLPEDQNQMFTPIDLLSLSHDDLLELLLTLWRLNNFDQTTYSTLARPSQLQSLFSHESQPVRCLAVRVFCQILGAADAKLEELLKQHIRQETDLVASLDGKRVDYAFLTLYEQARRDEIHALFSCIQTNPAPPSRTRIPTQKLTPLVLKYGKTVLPRPAGPVNSLPTLIHTPTTVANLERIAASLQNPGPVLLYGPASSGKTGLVQEIAREVGKRDGLITLHLNEQTDAKTLTGLYTCQKPGTFEWQAGVLTTSVREGRWVLIEDLDRAPTEVLGTILPLIERGELTVPGRGETIVAPSEFRIFATIRTSEKTSPPPLIGMRLWQAVHVQPLLLSDLRDVIIGKYPILEKYAPKMLSVYDRLTAATVRSCRSSRTGNERAIGPRDLIKWCSRVDYLLRAAGVKSAEEGIDETTNDRIFMEAVECFVGSVKDGLQRRVLVAGISKEMDFVPERVEHYLNHYVPELVETPLLLGIGRVTLAKRKQVKQVNGGWKPPRLFATTRHARRLLEQIAASTNKSEPTLLCGETGTGKTTVIQELASRLGHKLEVINLSNQSEASDLLGGFKPTSSRSLAMPIREEFEDLWEHTGISADRNRDYLNRISRKFAKGQYQAVSREWRKAVVMFDAILSKLGSESGNVDEQPAKRRKTGSSRLQRLGELKPRWDAFLQSLDDFDRQASSSGFAFAFVESRLTKALRLGNWVLLDEINLAPADTLDAIADVFQPEPFLLLSETGEIERVRAHPDFRLFASMNPATDISKRDLPLGLRSRFTEIYVHSPDSDKKDLVTIIKTFLKGSSSIERLSDGVADLYLEIKKRAVGREVADQAGEVPHFSLRTLSRVLGFVTEKAPIYGLERALYEGFLMGFTTSLDVASYQLVLSLIQQYLLKRPSIMAQPPKRPQDGRAYVSFRSSSNDNQVYWLLQGQEEPRERRDYIVTPYIERNLLNLVRATSTRRSNILVQGPTSAGKTSLIEYLANRTGSKFVRINNHENEYVGTYVSDADGKLQFRDGLLVQAMREGSWLVLDELNLAPSEVLEALNRLLDENRELLIPETQEIVRPRDGFVLFATQNPAGLYGGRKPLSRAFRNRFLELHFDDIPEDELQTILQSRCRNTAPSDCKRIVDVYKQLARLGQESQVFQEKHSFATLRDLFRWAFRPADSRQDMAENGFMLIAERVRDRREREQATRIIESVFKVSIKPDLLYGHQARELEAVREKRQGLVLTRSMRRLYILVSRALQSDENVLLVGETGTGKTSIVQALADATGAALRIVNCHSSTEAADLIGSQRPSRERATSKALFEWQDGSLVTAMKEGSIFLLDEINLAEDSVLERLNPVLEPHRSLILAEKGAEDCFVQAAREFRLVATMNPGGDFGKRDLSPALRNRFTEIWVPAITDEEDVLDIISSRLGAEFQKVPKMIISFASWFQQSFRPWASKFSLRDILKWTDFVATIQDRSEVTIAHGAAMVYMDSLGAEPSALETLDSKSVEERRGLCLQKLQEILGCPIAHIYGKPSIESEDDLLSIGDFSIRRYAGGCDARQEFLAPTTKMNAMRLVRALQATGGPILLEGPPGVGKTTLISTGPTALARVVGRPLVRYNLSDQTDMMDLFGSDVPVESASAGTFEWRNGPFLEEMNLAPPPILEGLNAVLDHRGEAYIAELDKTFKKHPEFRLFAAQNAHRSGGGRKGLPASFVNRFTVVYTDHFTEQDLLDLTAGKFESIGPDRQTKLIRFITRLNQRLVVEKAFGSAGSPWEFNLRDILRWADMLASSDALTASGKAQDYLDVVVRHRFRSEHDREEVSKLFLDVFQQGTDRHGRYHDLNPYSFQVGNAILPRGTCQETPFPAIEPIPRLAELESVMLAVKQNLPCILVGPSGSGKSALLNHLAALAGKKLVIFPLHADVDGIDLIGGWEQQDLQRDVNTSIEKLARALTEHVLCTVPSDVPASILELTVASRWWATGRRHPTRFMDMIESVQADVFMPRQLSDAMQEAVASLRKRSTLEGTPGGSPRFEWVDGTIVRALTLGDWLVLENANLCSASVLDRLNSLLERPNSFLSINEKNGPEGEPMVVKPHPDFRIFLTCDPKYGELSRAMRNRGIEIFLDGSLPLDKPRPGFGHVDGTLQRFTAAINLVKSQQEIDLSFNILSLADMSMLRPFLQAAMDGLGVPASNLAAATERLSELIQFTVSGAAESLRDDLVRFYHGAMSMPLHPLQNSSMLAILEQGQAGAAASLAFGLELHFDLHRLESEMASHARNGSPAKPSSLTRFQRSCMADRLAGASKDSTVHAASFLWSIQQAVKAYQQQGHAEAAHWKERRSMLRRLMLYLKRTLSFLSALPFEEARFQAHLARGQELFGKLAQETQDDGSGALLGLVLERLDADFACGFQLSTGLSLDVLWENLRPEPFTCRERLEQAMELERLAERFDMLRWRVAASISDQCSIQESMSNAYQSVRKLSGDASDLVQDLRSELSTLEAKMVEHGEDHTPFMASAFEALRQITVLDDTFRSGQTSSRSSEVTVLSNTPTLALFKLRGRKTTLNALSYMMANQGDMHPWKDGLAKSLVLKFDSISSASLRELGSLQRELPVMGRSLAKATGAMGANHVFEKLGIVLLKLMDQVFSAHGDGLDGCATALYRRIKEETDMDVDADGRWDTRQKLSLPPGPWPIHFVDIFEQHISRALVALAASQAPQAGTCHPFHRPSQASTAWVEFAVACVKLFVPDKPFDPYLRLQVAAEFDRNLWDKVQQELAAQDKFQLAFTGHVRSPRGDVLREEVLELGEPTSAPRIYRPGDAGLRELQGEFTKVLNAVVKKDVRSIFQEVETVSDNVGRLIQAFSTGFAAYQDLTGPLVNFLWTLQIGLSLRRVCQVQVQALAPGHESRANRANRANPLTRVTPFFGGVTWKAERSELPLPTLDFLTWLQTIVAVEGQVPDSLRHSLYESLALLYEHGCKKDESDRKAEEDRNRLYRFRGSREDEEAFDQEEFDLLFPDYSSRDGVAKQKKQQHQVRDLSITVAEAHESIFMTPRDAQESLRDLCRQTGRKMAGEEQAAEEAGQLLAASLLLFDQRARMLDELIDPCKYNFYTDANLVAVGKLLGLVTAIKSRFQYLGTVEEIGHHSSLTDVIVASDAILDMAIDQPLASAIILVERLYNCVHEWQDGGWATSANKATALFDSLRDLICGWRRLELASWSRLLDTEERKCREDARSGWFNLYGSVILEPISRLKGGQDLKAYAVELVRRLRDFLSTAELAQFSSRLNLVRQLKRQVDLIIIELRPMVAIRDAIENFVRYHDRFAIKVAAAIKHGREPLERSMKDVFLMAKWREQNIEALRQSAVKNHQKLFKLVRKFRDVLKQPVHAILEQVLPEESGLVEFRPGVASVTPTIDAEAAGLCRRLMEEVTKHPQWVRLSNPDMLLATMLRLGTIPMPSPAVQACHVLDSSAADLLSSIAALRKESPDLLTQDTAHQVKQLKSRKTKLLHDTLRSVKEMGFRTKVDTTTLENQQSIEAVLAKSGLLEGLGEGTGLDQSYFRILDVSARARQAALKPHDDLSRRDVDRSIGYLEGILYEVIRQRQYLSRKCQQMTAVDKGVHAIKELSAPASISHPRQTGNDEQAACWLVQMIRFGIHLMETHARLGNIDNRDPIATLTRWAECLSTVQADLRGASRLPAAFTSSRLEQIQARLDAEMGLFLSELDTMGRQRPDLVFVTREIGLWVDRTREEVVGEGKEDGIETVAAKVMHVASKVMVAVQHFQQHAQALSSSAGDASWLKKLGDGLEASVDALRFQAIADETEAVVGSLQNLDLDNATYQQATTALLRLFLPILQQYQNVCKLNLVQIGLLHQATCKLGSTLGSSFIQLAANGFCTPPERSDDKAGESGELENGTGLGEGEGAEDISKDIKADEDLSELAQDAGNQGGEKEIEDEKDAVDMGQDELEGELGDVAGSENEKEEGDGSGDEEGEESMEEEAGEVDDLDPTAVDEKMWDGNEDGVEQKEQKEQKEQQGDKASGQKDDDQTAAASDGQRGESGPAEDEVNQDQEEEGGESGGEQEEDVGQEELNRQDQHVDQTDRLDLPEHMEMEMDMDMADDPTLSGDEDVEGLSEAEGPDGFPELDKQDSKSQDGEDEQGPPEDGQDGLANAKTEKDDPDVDGAEQGSDMDMDKEGHEKQDESDEIEEQKIKSTAPDGGVTDQNKAAPSDARDGGGQATSDDGQEGDFQNKAAQQDQGGIGESAVDQEGSTGTGGNGALSRADPDPDPDLKPKQHQALPEHVGADGSDARPFRRIGDALERWYRKQNNIQPAPSEPKPEADEASRQRTDADMARAEFQHVQDDKAEADTQALGTATDEEVKPMDDAMAIDMDMEESGSPILAEEEENDEPDQAKNKEDKPSERPERSNPEADDGRSGAMTRQGALDADGDEVMSGIADDEAEKEEEEEEEEKKKRMVDETSTRLSETHLDKPEGRDAGEALQLWLDLQGSTHCSALALQSQLHTILTPTRATKLSGGYRTGKRLAIRKLIAFIASDFKRDKIWMRRAIPHKRAYQVILAVDDSSSMGDDGSSSAGLVALEALVMVSRALAMLEVGQVGVLRFGTDTDVAHPLGWPSDMPFATEPQVGARVLQRFTFAQPRTDMARLVRTTIDQFVDARLRTTTASAGIHDLWQLALVLSDGLLQSAELPRLRPLLREAGEKRIMIVFVLIDHTRAGGSSVVDLKEARFDADGNPVVTRYLDAFPFPYYLLVQRTEDLPAALAGLLRTWFAELAE